MRVIVGIMGWVGTILLASAGCSAPAEPSERTVARVTADSPERFERLWETAGDALRGYYFRLDRQDRLEGVITTYPETSAHFFEFWRPQPEPAYAWAESNLHTIQRQATITLKPAAAGAYDLDVRVERMRYNLEERQIDNSAGALRMFSAEAPTMSGRMDSPSATGTWIPLGRDKLMEERLLNLILRRYDRAAARTQPAS
ncbi:MAG: hypothetical protein HRF43_12915 [Phycisphaerae bacterium]|jgi:hypothetical protein